jgi:hypothetical protein
MIAKIARSCPGMFKPRSPYRTLPMICRVTSLVQKAVGLAFVILHVFLDLYIMVAEKA